MKKHVLQLLSLILALCMVFALVGCGAAPAEPAAEEAPAAAAPKAPAEEEAEEAPAEEAAEETLKVALDGEPSGLYAQYSYNNPTAIICNLLYDTLVKWDAEKNCVVPNLATSWEWIDDTHMRMTLRDDVVFADGSPLTAEDVIYTFEVGGEYQASSYSRIFDAANFVAEDEHTVVLALNAPYPIIADILAADVYGIISKSAVEAAGGVDEAARNPVIGSGKYDFAEWVDGQYIKLVRNEEYWNKDAMPYYKEIVLSFINDNTSRAMAVQSGDVDIATGLGTSQVESLSADSSLNVAVTNTSTNRSLYMNCSDEALAKEEVRTAIWDLLNAAAIRDIANSGFGELSETSFSQFCAVYAAPPADFVREVNVEEAKALLEQAGYGESNPLTLGLMMPAEGDNETMAQLVQAQLAEGGINVEIEMLEIGSFLQKLWGGDYQLTLTSGDQYDYEKLLYMVDGRIDPATASGGAQYDDPDFQVLLDKCYGETDDAARNALYAEIQNFLLEHHIVIGVCNQVNVTAMKAGIGGLSLNISTCPDLSVCKPE